jgi:nucleotide-binding universal stress UspA family protein
MSATTKGKFSKILVTIDGSEPSMDAVDHAILMSERCSSDLMEYNGH